MRNRIFSTLILLSIVSQLNAQAVKVVRDFRLRASLEAKKEFCAKFTLRTEIGSEFEKDISRLGKYYFEGNFEYSPWPFLDAGIEYRLTSNRKKFKNEYDIVNRYAIYLGARKKIDRLNLSYQVKYQTIDDDFYFLEDPNLGNDVLKNRLKIKYNLPKTKLSPYVSTEICLQIENKFQPTVLKTIIGCDYKIKEIGVLSGYYKIERELGSSVPYIFGTLGFNFCFNF